MNDCNSSRTASPCDGHTCTGVARLLEQVNLRQHGPELAAVAGDEEDAAELELAELVADGVELCGACHRALVACEEHGVGQQQATHLSRRRGGGSVGARGRGDFDGACTCLSSPACTLFVFAGAASRCAAVPFVPG